ncbi:hypothetical protein HDV05_000621 [Chytridiales sp. JEL 0842]|nr:hypothetical protein HDV05_000621 [Chytridiales sp. JEL 0842]
MGLLSLGTPLQWDEAKQHADHVRKHGIIQFINIWNKVKKRRRDHLLWGDEVEYIVLYLDEEKKTAKVSLHGHDALEKLQALENKAIAAGETFPSSWKPEYGRYMLEGTPGSPYGSTLEDLLNVEPNMRERRLLAVTALKPQERIVTMANFPRLGCPDSTEPVWKPNPVDGPSRSLFIPDQAINPHPRFSTLTANIRERRQSKVAINMPIFKDQNTPSPFKEPSPLSLADPNLNLPEFIKRSTSTTLPTTIDPLKLDKTKLPSLPDVIPDAKPDHIYMDCMCFGMGCSCLQVTFQACSIEEARRLYDHLSVVSPIMMALSAATPVFRGYLADVDCRWSVISGSVDDRTKEERQQEPLKTSRFTIPKSRYDSISTYLTSGPSYSGGCAGVPLDEKSGARLSGNYFKEKYNDIPLVHDEKIFQDLTQNGVDEALAKHYAHLFIRDPLVIFAELLNVDDALSSDHFENIQSTNWQTMRFKPPPPNSNIGWRVEFRSMEIQITDFENAAFAIFIVLLTRTILSLDLNFYIPLSKVDENMKTAHKRDAAVAEKFWFRRNVFGNPAKRPEAFPKEESGQEDDKVELMSADEIVNGKPNGFPGLIPLVKAYLSATPIDHTTASTLYSYLDLVSKKASGELPTAAAWIRKYVRSHKAYKGDSVVSEEINFDLVNVVDRMGRAEGRVEGLNV